MTYLTALPRTTRQHFSPIRLVYPVLATVSLSEAHKPKMG